MIYSVRPVFFDWPSNGSRNAVQTKRINRPVHGLTLVQGTGNNAVDSFLAAGEYSRELTQGTDRAMGENEVAGLPPSGSMASAVTVTDRGVAFDTLSRLPLCHRAVVSRVSGLSRYVVKRSRCS